MFIKSVIYSLKFILIQIVGEFIYFPIWWYTKGLIKAAEWWSDNLSSFEKNLALKIWIRHIFSPMYAERDISGRLISFFVRLVVLILRLVVFILALIIFTALFILYVLALPIIVIMIIYNFM